jgi:hypothetical protein
MTREQVESVLGGPPGDYSTGPTIGPWFRWWFIGGSEEWPFEHIVTPNERFVSWRNDETEVDVVFDDSGTVTAAMEGQVRRIPLNWHDDLLWKVKRLVTK